MGSPYLTSVGVMEPGYHDRSWSLVLCLGRSKEHDGLQPHRPLIGGSGGGDTLDTQVMSTGSVLIVLFSLRI